MNARSWRPTCKRSSAARGRACSCNRTRTRRWPTATPSATAARSSARLTRFSATGATLACGFAQAVKQKYRHERPKPGTWHVRQPLAVDAVLTQDGLVVVARTGEVEVRRALAGPFADAHDLAAMEQAVRGCFGRLGQSRFRLEA